jgi:2,6-dihydroxypseudooxynicotine hydrolase
MYHLRNYASMPELTQAGFMYVTGSKSLDEARPYFESVDLDGIAERITCPLMIIHGGLDLITPTENAYMLRDAAKGPVELLFWEDSIHCAHDRSHLCRPAMADFMKKWLTA